MKPEILDTWNDTRHTLRNKWVELNNVDISDLPTEIAMSVRQLQRDLIELYGQFEIVQVIMENNKNDNRN